MRGKLVILLAALWAALFVTSIAVGFLLAPTGVGFLRGINRAIAVAGWQGAAAVSALVLAVVALGIARPRGRLLSILGFGPLVLTGLIVLGVALLIAWFAFFAPVAEPQTGPTLPVTEAPAPVTQAPPPVTQAPG